MPHVHRRLSIELSDERHWATFVKEAKGVFFLFRDDLKKKKKVRGPNAPKDLIWTPKFVLGSNVLNSIDLKYILTNEIQWFIHSYEIAEIEIKQTSKKCILYFHLRFKILLISRSVSQACKSQSCRNSFSMTVGTL